jgi:hypothetical protein
MTDKINDFVDLETAAEQFQVAIISAYRENYLPTVRKNNRNISWWSQDLTDRRKFRRLFNATTKSGNWADYKRTLSDYNKALRQDKREEIL